MSSKNWCGLSFAAGLVIHLQVQRLQNQMKKADLNGSKSLTNPLWKNEYGVYVTKQPTSRLGKGKRRKVAKSKK